MMARIRVDKRWGYMAVAVCAAGLAVFFVWNVGYLGGRKFQIIQPGQNFTISIAEIGTTPQFYPLEIEGTKMELIAVKDAAGNVRTAFNTCQSCYASGKGYYKVEGGILICQNCGAHFTVDQVEVRAGSCNPYPILAENKTVEASMIQIPYDYLRESTGLFAKWKR